METLRATIKSLAKADLHNHLTLGPSLASLKKHYPVTNITKHSRFDGLDGMLEYVHGCINNEMATGADVARYMEIAIEDSIADNVKLLEASIDLNLVRYFDNSAERLIELVKDLKEKYQGRIQFMPDIGINKNVSLDKANMLGSTFIASGVFSGIDLYGPEINMPLHGFVDLFKVAKQVGLRTKVHIGEFSNPESINETINLFNPDDIQHGIKAAYSDRTMETILKRNIRLNICPQSNLALGSERSLTEHPIRQLFDFGIDLTVNTDDRLLFDASVSDQFIDLIEAKVFTFDEIDRIRRNALRDWNGN